MRLLHIARFELVRVARDANTLLYVGFPVLFYPLIGFLGLLAIQYVTEDQDRRPHRVALVDPVDRAALEGEPLVFVDGDLSTLDRGDLEVVAIREGNEVTLHHRAGSPLSMATVDLVVDRLGAAVADAKTTQAEALGLAFIEVDAIPVSRDDALAHGYALLLGFVFPLMLIVAVYAPLNELFVTEREKQTLETLLTSAARRAEIAILRLLVGTAIAVGATLANFAMFWLLLQYANVLLIEQSSLALPSLTGVFAVPLLVASTGMLVTTLVTMAMTLARTFREGQVVFSFVMYALLPVFAVAFYAMMEGWYADLHTFPLAHGPTLVFAALMGEITLGWTLYGVGSDLLLTAALLFVWDRVFGIATLLSGLERPAFLDRFMGDA